MPSFKMRPAAVLPIALVILLSACGKEETTEAAAEPAVTEKAQPAKSPDAEREARKAERLAKREARQTASSPEEKAAREARKAEKKAQRQANKEKSAEDKGVKDETESKADRLARKEERQRKNQNDRIQKKAWWNSKKGGKQFAEMDLSEDQISDMDSKLQALLATREALGGQLQPLWESNRSALASGDLDLIAANLQNIQQLQAQWQAERNAAMLDILYSLEAEQLAALAASGGDVASLDWLNIELERGIDKPGTRQGRQDRQRRQKN